MAARSLAVWLGVAALCGALGASFVRALPFAVEKAEVGRGAAGRAACEVALHPEPHNSALGGIPLPGAAAEAPAPDAPEFKLKDFAGREIALSSLRGRVVLLNFWATWCPTCVVEMPSLEVLAGAEQGRPLSLLAVSVDEAWDPVRRFFAKGSKLTVLLDAEKSVPPRYGTEKFPETFLIDRAGKVRYYVVSDRDWASAEMRACIDHLLDE